MNPEQLWADHARPRGAQPLPGQGRPRRRGRRDFLDADGRRRRAAPRLHPGQRAEGRESGRLSAAASAHTTAAEPAGPSPTTKIVAARPAVGRRTGRRPFHAAENATAGAGASGRGAGRAAGRRTSTSRSSAISMPFAERGREVCRPVAAELVVFRRELAETLDRAPVDHLVDELAVGLRAIGARLRSPEELREALAPGPRVGCWPSRRSNGQIRLSA